MSIKDVIKNGFLNNFINSISLEMVIVTISISILFAFGLYFIYLFTCDKAIYSKKFNVAMCLMSIMTAGIVLSMQANVVVSLGMVGALSIVRFRTAIKEAKDLLFLFWAIGNGIIIGAGLYSIAFVVSIALGICLLILEVLPIKKKGMLLVVNLTNIKHEGKINNILKKEKVKYNIKSRNVFKNKADIIYEISVKNEDELLIKLSRSKEILSMNLIKQD